MPNNITRWRDAYEPTPEFLDASTSDNPNYFIPGFSREPNSITQWRDAGERIDNIGIDTNVYSQMFTANNIDTSTVDNQDIEDQDYNIEKEKLRFANALMRGFKSVYQKNTPDYLKNILYDLDEMHINRMSADFKKWLIRMAKCAVTLMAEYENINAELLNRKKSLERRSDTNEI